MHPVPLVAYKKYLSGLRQGSVTLGARGLGFLTLGQGGSPRLGAVFDLLGHHLKTGHAAIPRLQLYDVVHLVQCQHNWHVLGSATWPPGLGVVTAKTLAPASQPSTQVCMQHLQQPLRLRSQASPEKGVEPHLQLDRRSVVAGASVILLPLGQELRHLLLQLLLPREACGFRILVEAEAAPHSSSRRFLTLSRPLPAPAV